MSDMAQAGRAHGAEKLRGGGAISGGGAWGCAASWVRVAGG